MPFDKSLLLDPPAFPASGYAPLADRIARLMATRNDVVFVQAEAVVALEAVATSLATPGFRVLNLVTSPYGALFGGWLRRGGASVFDLRPAEPARPVMVEAVAAAILSEGPFDAIALVHAESASGILNPLEAIAALARANGLLLIVDAVASIGGHPLEVDALGIDIAVIGPQKAMGGPAGISALSISDRAWSLIDRPDAPRASILSLLDQKRDWLETGRGALPGTPPVLEFHALEAALDRVEAEGLVAMNQRHADAAEQVRKTLGELGLESFEQVGRSSNLVTTVALPSTLTMAEFLAMEEVIAAEITAGVGEAATHLVRINHTGPRANPEIVAKTLSVLASVLSQNRAGSKL